MDTKLIYEAIRNDRKSSVDKFIKSIKSKGVDVILTDGELDNVLFVLGDITYKIAHHVFYRYSGISSIQKDKGEREIEYIHVTNEMYLEMMIRPNINRVFNLK